MNEDIDKRLRELLKPATKKDGWNYDIIEADLDELLVIMVRFISSEINKAKPQWISVKDKLPESSNFYIAYDGLVIIHFYDWVTKKWEDYGGDKIVTVTEVTHWMPLPEPPTSELKEHL